VKTIALPEHSAREVQRTYGTLVTPIFIVPVSPITNTRPTAWAGKVDSGHPYHTLHQYPLG